MQKKIVNLVIALVLLFGTIAYAQIPGGISYIPTQTKAGELGASGVKVSYPDGKKLTLHAYVFAPQATRFKVTGLDDMSRFGFDLGKTTGGVDMSKFRINFYPVSEGSDTYYIDIMYTGTAIGVVRMDPTVDGVIISGTGNGFQVTLKEGGYVYRDFQIEYANGTYKGQTLEGAGYVINTGTENVQLIVTAYDSYGDKVIIPNNEIKWSSDAWNNVRISSGWLNGKKIGTSANISATLKDTSLLWGDKPNTCLVNVIPDSVVIRDKDTVMAQLIPGCDEIAIYADVNPAGANADPVVWSVSDWSVCSLRYSYVKINGVNTPVAYVKCKKVGPCTITVALKDKPEAFDTVDVPCDTRLLNVVSKNPKYPIVEEGGKKYIDCDKNTIDLILNAEFDAGRSDYAVVWDTENWNRVAYKYNNDGCYLSVKDCGITGITCTDKVTGASDTVYIRVKHQLP